MKKVLIVLVVLVVLVVAAGAMLSGEMRVERSTVIRADLAKVHEMCGELKNWPRWGPWHDQDPTIVTTLGEKTTGVGASQRWTGKDGDGELTFTRCDAQAGITYDMTFIDGERKMPSVGIMNYKPVADGVEVEWIMESRVDVPIVGGYMAMVFEPMIGSMFDAGLVKLKTVCETP